MAKRQKRVFILGGGAALGAHHVGALKHLEELDVRPDAIIASSIGVLNACAYLTGGVPLLETVWREFNSLPAIVAPSLRDNLVVGLSLFTMRRLTGAVERYFDFAKVLASPVELEIVLLNVSRGRAEMHSKRQCADIDDLRTLSRAGYAIPLLFPPIRYHGDWMVDGGFAWNTPLDRAIDLGATEIWLLAPIASQLPYVGRFATSFGYLKRVVDVLFRTIGNAGYLHAPMDRGRFHGVPVTVIEPGEEWSGVGPLALFHAHPRKSRSLMAAGYRDAKRAIAARRRLEESVRAARRAHRPTTAGRIEGGASAVEGVPGKVIPIRSNDPGPDR